LVTLLNRLMLVSPNVCEARLLRRRAVPGEQVLCVMPFQRNSLVASLE
jgi:hypothetical protein